MTDQEINEAVARKLGWTLFETPNKDNPMPNWVRPDGNEIPSSNPPDYCHSIAAAWEIVEWLSKQNVDGYHYSVSISNMDTDPDGWYCSISHLDSPMMPDLPQEKADTAPMAICLTFLKLK